MLDVQAVLRCDGFWIGIWNHLLPTTAIMLPRLSKACRDMYALVRNVLWTKYRATANDIVNLQLTALQAQFTYIYHLMTSKNYKDLQTCLKLLTGSSADSHVHDVDELFLWSVRTFNELRKPDTQGFLKFNGPDKDRTRSLPELAVSMNDVELVKCFVDYCNRPWQGLTAEGADRSDTLMHLAAVSNCNEEVGNCILEWYKRGEIFFDTSTALEDREPLVLKHLMAIDNRRVSPLMKAVSSFNVDIVKVLVNQQYGDLVNVDHTQDYGDGPETVGKNYDPNILWTLCAGWQTVLRQFHCADTDSALNESNTLPEFYRARSWLRTIDKMFDIIFPRCNDKTVLQKDQHGNNLFLVSVRFDARHIANKLVRKFPCLFVHERPNTRSMELFGNWIVYERCCLKIAIDSVGKSYDEDNDGEYLIDLILRTSPKMLSVHMCDNLDNSVLILVVRAIGDTRLKHNDAIIHAQPMIIQETERKVERLINVFERMVLLSNKGLIMRMNLMDQTAMWSAIHWTVPEAAVMLAMRCPDCVILDQPLNIADSDWNKYRTALNNAGLWPEVRRRGRSGRVVRV